MADKDVIEIKEKKETKKPKKEKVKKEKVKVEKTKKTKKQPKKRETVVFVNSDEEAQAIINEIVQEDSRIDKKEQKRNNFWSEVKAFFAIVLIIGLTVLGGFLIYKYVKPIEKDKPKEDEETKIVESNDYKTVVYTAPDERTLEVIDDKYVIETKDSVLYKVMDMDRNTLFEGKEEYSELYVGIDDELYLVFNDTKNEGALSLYRITDKELKEITVLNTPNYYYVPMIYTNNGIDKLVAVLGQSYNFVEDNEDFDMINEVINLDGEKQEVKDYIFEGDTARLGFDVPVYSNSSRYFVVYTENGSKRGVYDILNEEIVISGKYSELYTTKNGNYIAVKNGKSGIVNLKSKILVDFKYDFISDNGEFYVVSKNKKLGILDKDYKVVVEPKFAYQESTEYGFNYKVAAGIYDSFVASKYKDKYVLTINANELVADLDYKVHETYVIDSTGEYITIKANEFNIYDNLIYGYDIENKKYTIYDNTFAEKYVIDLNGYDFDTNPRLEYVNENSIVVYMDSTLYFDSLTGEEIDTLKDATFVVDKIEFKYSNKNKNVTLKVNGDILSTYDYDAKMATKFYNNIKDKMYYYVSDNLYVMVRKSE